MSRRNDVPPVLPGPVVSAVAWIFLRATGLRDAVGIIGGAMLLTGVVAIARSLRSRRLAQHPAVAPESAGASALPARSERKPPARMSHSADPRA